MKPGFEPQKQIEYTIENRYLTIRINISSLTGLLLSVNYVL